MQITSCPSLVWPSLVGRPVKMAKKGTLTPAGISSSCCNMARRLRHAGHRFPSYRCYQRRNNSGKRPNVWIHGIIRPHWCIYVSRRFGRETFWKNPRRAVPMSRRKGDVREHGNDWGIKRVSHRVELRKNTIIDMRITVMTCINEELVRCYTRSDDNRDNIFYHTVSTAWWEKWEVVYGPYRSRLREGQTQI